MFNRSVQEISCGDPGVKGLAREVEYFVLYNIYLYMSYSSLVSGYLSRKVSFQLFKIFEIQKCRTFSCRPNDILSSCRPTIVVNMAIRSRA